jgi:P-type conjugative transfer protein TrbJ
MKRFLKNATLIVGSIVGIGISVSSYAIGTPVFDYSNWLQNTAAVSKQIEQYNKQIEQWKIMVANSKNPTNWTWDPANQTVTNFLNTTNLDYYKNQNGSVQNYLSHYQDIKNQNPCFSSDNCSDQQRQTLVTNSQIAGSEALKRANDAMLLGIDQQQQTLKDDSNHLNELQTQAQGVTTGQTAAIQAGNQIASAQANQLLQVRALLIAQQNAEATKAQVVADREAQQSASHQAFIKGSFVPSPVVKW